MSNQKVSATDIKNLTLESLLSGVTINKSHKAQPKKPSPSEERELMIARAAEKHLALQRQISPWKPEAAVLCLVQTTCTMCQSTYTSPASESLLVRFRHSRNDSTWETANHPSQLNPGLPRETKTLHRSVHACPNCFKDPVILDHYQDQQLAQPMEALAKPAEEE